MFIATEAARRELRQEFHVPVRTLLHFTPDRVSRPRTGITINMALLTEGQTTDHRLQSSDPFAIGPTSNHAHPSLRRTTRNTHNSMKSLSRGDSSGGSL